MSVFRLVTCALTLVLVLFSISGCNRKEKLLDVETPSGELEIERDVESGRVDIEVRDKDDPQYRP